MAKNKELERIEADLKKLYSQRNKINEQIFREEELPQLEAQVGKYFMFASGGEVVHLTDFDEEEGYRVEETTLQKEKNKVVRFIQAVYWKGWYPFYDIKAASPIGHGYTEITKKQAQAFVEKALQAKNKI